MRDKIDIYKRLANIVLVLTHPFVIPLYVMFLMFYGGTVYGFLPSMLKLNMMLATTVNTLVLPLLFVVMLASVSYLRMLSTKIKRMMTIVVVASFYVVCASMFSNVLFVLIVHKFFVAAILCAIFALFTTYFWNISTHMIGIGCAFFILIWISISGVGQMLLPTVVFVVMGGLAASAQLYLGRHNGIQIVTGFLGGFMIAAAVIAIRWT